jgi:alpha-beta hydrolase superfamily lysophospholipase
LRAEPFGFQASDGARLHVERWLPEGPARAWIQIVHGMGEHARRYARLAGRACAEGFAVAAHDVRGHGLSAAPGALGDLGPGGWQAAVRDVDELGSALLGERPVPRILFGHSMGSFLVRAALARPGAPLCGCALSGPGLVSRGLARLAAAIAAFEVLRLGVSARSPLLRRLVFGRAERAVQPARTPFDWLSRDPVEVDAYVRDPTCGFVLTAGSLREMFAALDALERGEDLGHLPRSLPIYVFSGADDPVSGHRAVRGLAGRYQRAGLERISTRIYPEDRHETLNELDRQQVERDLLDWISSCVPPAAP